MGVGLGGVQQLGAGSVVADLVGQDLLARSIALSRATGADAITVNNNGARVHFGAGASDYASSDGTTVTFAGPIAATAGVGVTAIGIPVNSRIALDAGNVDNIRSAGVGVGIYSSLTLIADWNNGTGNYTHRVGDITVAAGNAYALAARLAVRTAPTVVAGAGASVTASNGTAAFTINLGAAAQTGTITFPAATTGWVVYMQDITTPASFVFGQTGGTATTATFTCYSRTTGLAINWTANDILACLALAY